jgi:hypothetical protein
LVCSVHSEESIKTPTRTSCNYFSDGWLLKTLLKGTAFLLRRASFDCGSLSKPRGPPLPGDTAASGFCSSFDRQMCSFTFASLLDFPPPRRQHSGVTRMTLSSESKETHPRAPRTNFFNLLHPLCIVNTVRDFSGSLLTFSADLCGLPSF